MNGETKALEGILLDPEDRPQLRAQESPTLGSVHILKVGRGAWLLLPVLLILALLGLALFLVMFVGFKTTRLFSSSRKYTFS
jgi:hypothetical protein